ncbi:MAG TPA: hypothetical protein VJ184_04965, partial [Chryseolinea sp.]|nr:hypothetical protein [Chryseolinea sp.]
MFKIHLFRILNAERKDFRAPLWPSLLCRHARSTNFLNITAPPVGIPSCETMPATTYTRTKPVPFK